MATQSRRIYQVGTPHLDMILSDIAARLDVIEGLRPDLSAGLLTLTAGKSVSTTADNFLEIVTGITLANNLLTLTESVFEIKDENGTTIHKME
jgi:TctA family transporter